LDAHTRLAHAAVAVPLNTGTNASLHAGHWITKVGDGIDLEDLADAAGPRCSSFSGFSVHANVSVAAHDRPRLEQLCRYTAHAAVTIAVSANEVI
jgi:hypothetical protein